MSAPRRPPDFSAVLESGCLIIAEVAQAHDGSLGMAHAYIDAVADAGAQAVKFQTHIADAESTPAEPWRVKFSPQDDSRFDYWRRMEFTPPQWHALKAHADERGLLFLSSPFSLEAVALLSEVGVPAWKVASGEITNRPLLDAMLATGRPILLSSGMSSWEELDKVVAHIREAGVDYAVLQCTSLYPTPAEKVGLNMVPLLAQRYGLSDHSATIYPGLAAVTLGASIVEVHVTMSREMFGPDVIASLTTAELRQLVDGSRFIERMNASPVDKNVVAEEMQPMRQLFTKSVVYRVDLPAGATLQPEHVTAKKPGTGVPVSHLPDLLGKRLSQAVSAGEFLQQYDFES